MANEQNLKKGNPETQFKSGRSAVENGRKGGLATAANRRRKNAFRKYLQEVLVCRPTLTDNDRRGIEKLGVNPEADLDVEALIVLGVAQKALAKDLRAVEMVLEYMGEDPYTVREEKRLKVQREAVNALKNSDGFMEAMGGVVGEVFEDGGDTPDTLEDSE